MPGMTPRFSMLDWVLTSETRERLVYRPEKKVLFYRVLLAAIMIPVGVFAYYGSVTTLTPFFSTPPTERSASESQEPTTPIPEGVTEAEWERALALSQERMERLEGSAYIHGPTALFLLRSALLVFIAFMLLLPASVFWSHVTLSITPRRALEISQWLLVPRRISIALADLRSLQYGAQEIFRRTTTGQVTDHYWRWFIQLQTSTGVDTPIAAILYPCREPNRPALSQATSGVASLIQWLQAHAQLHVSGPYFKEAAFARGKRSHVYEPPLPPAGSTRPFTHPGHNVRPTAPGKYTEHVSHHIEVEENGIRRHYGSREALPEHIRRVLPPQEMVPASMTSSERIVIRNSDGTETRYNSLDELPPELRARFEAARKNFLDSKKG